MLNKPHCIDANLFKYDDMQKYGTCLGPDKHAHIDVLSRHESNKSSTCVELWNLTFGILACEVKVSVLASFEPFLIWIWPKRNRTFEIDIKWPF